MTTAHRNYNIIYESPACDDELHGVVFRYRYSRSRGSGSLNFNNVSPNLVTMICINDIDYNGDNIRVILSGITRVVKLTTVRIKLTSESGSYLYYNLNLNSLAKDGHHMFNVTYMRSNTDTLFADGDIISLNFEFDDLCYSYNYGGGSSSNPGIGNISYTTSGSSQISISDIDANGNDLSDILNLVIGMSRRYNVVMKISNPYNSSQESYWSISNGIDNGRWHQLIVSWKHGEISTPRSPIRVCFKFDSDNGTGLSCTSVTMYSNGDECFNKYCIKSGDGVYGCCDDYYKYLESNRCLLSVRSARVCGDITSSFRVYPDSNSFRVTSSDPFRQLSNIDMITPYIFVSEKEALLVITVGPEIVSKVREALERNGNINYRPQRHTTSDITISDIIHWKNLIQNRKLTVLFFDMSMKCRIGETRCSLELTPELALSIVDV